MKPFFFVLLFFAPRVFFAQGMDGEIELAGFLLGQYRNTVHHEFGKPFEKRISDEGWLYEFHALTPDTSVYALFKYPKWDTTRIYSIQLNGDKFDEMYPFKGLKLGAKKENVDKVFGTSTRTELVDDPPLIIEYYDHKNYSFDINRNLNTLYGIQIYGRILEQKPHANLPDLTPFKNAILSRNIDSLLMSIAPDVEFYHQGKVIRFTTGARREFANPNSDLVRHLLGETGSVWYAFEREKAQEVPEQRIYNKRNDVTTVYKFPASSVLSEIVFIPHAGKWKVYEIRFR
ncbi:MAG TPA: hypothetical protein VEB86_02920 [Chryseosolibacter sp.]|nr:hypothetical protein [Chryseosolibacter sp.]